MKKSIAGILFFLLVTGMAFSVLAMPNEKIGIDVYYGTPDLDGEISEGEWDEENALILNRDNALAWSGEVTGDITYYYAWDEEALYMGVKVVDDDVNMPESMDEVYQLDAVQFAIDPAGLIGADGKNGGMFFSIAKMEDGAVGAVYHPYGGAGEDFVYEGASAWTEDGYSLEIMIPWEESIEILAADGYAWKHGDGENINFIVAMLDRDDNGETSNCYMTAIGENPAVDFTPANYCCYMTLHETTAPSLREGIISEEPVTVDMYDPSGEKEAVPVMSGDEVGYRFIANAPFDKLSVSCPSWGNNIGSMRFSLYEWKGTYVETVASQVLATKKYVDFADNATLAFEFSEKSAGEYLLLLHDTDETVGVWNYLTNVTGGFVYKNGGESVGEFQASIHYTMTPEVYFGKCESAPTEPSNPEEPEEDLSGIISKEPITVNMYDSAGEKEAVPVLEGNEVGYRFIATAPFDALDVSCPSWGNNIGSMRFSLFEWKGTYSETVKEQAVATKMYIDFVDNATLFFEFAEQKAGEYLLLLHDTDETVGVWNYLTNISGGFVYKNGGESVGEFQAAIHYTMTPEVNFGTCESAPAEPSVPEENPDTDETEEIPSGIISKDPVVVPMYDPAGTKEALSILKGQNMGYRFSATAPFEALSVSCPSWSNNIGIMRFSLYQWDNDYTTTVNGDTLATEVYVDYVDNATLTFAFEEMPAGEYMLLLHNTEETVGVWNYFSNVSGGYVYKDGRETSGEFQASIHYTMTPEVNFGECESVIAPPPETEYSEDDILNVRDAMSDTWDAVDGLGRVLPDHEDTGDEKQDKFVGLFYWTWHSEYAKTTQPYNITDILNAHPTAANNINHSAWGSLGTVHFWDEPLFGYYSTVDDWVLRKHAEMLADAGVDVIIFDNTNGTYTWKESYTRVFEVFAQAREDGVDTPQIAFHLPFIAGEWTNTQLEELYADIYSQERYQELWFYWEGKPLIMAYPDSLNTSIPLHHEISQFFTFRPGQASYTEGQTRQDMWGWLSVYPQQVYYNEDGTPEQMAVGVAQNYSAEKGLTAMNGTNVFGRTYTSNGYDTQENAELYGANFAEQFEYALKVDPEFIFITGWNEWVALRQESWLGVSNAFADQYNATYSRDIEPSSGVLKDHYYYQMVSYIRQFKGTNAVPEASEAVTIQMNGDASQWENVLPNYISYQNNISSRNSAGYLNTYYINNTGRNDISLAKVARDEENVYFYVECVNDITSSTDANWMRLLIDTKSGEDSWEGYEFILNREKAGVLERSLGGWNWETVGEVQFTKVGKVLQVTIPRTLLDLSENDFTIRFKWADNNLTEDANGNVDIMDFYQYGDTAPGGRFTYRYTTAQ